MTKRVANKHRKQDPKVMTKRVANKHRKQDP